MGSVGSVTRRPCVLSTREMDKGLAKYGRGTHCAGTTRNDPTVSGYGSGEYECGCDTVAVVTVPEKLVSGLHADSTRLRPTSESVLMAPTFSFRLLPTRSEVKKENEWKSNCKSRRLGKPPAGVDFGLQLGKGASTSRSRSSVKGKRDLSLISPSREGQ